MAEDEYGDFEGLDDDVAGGSGQLSLHNSSTASLPYLNEPQIVKSQEKRPNPVDGPSSCCWPQATQAMLLI